MLAIVCRLAGFYFEPLLSDDYFRFIWDGMLIHGGINPFEYLPSSLIEQPEIIKADSGLYAKLNSKDYYSVYPPIAQLLFYISYSINDLNYTGHIIFYKSILLIADLSVIFLLSKLLKQYNLSASAVLIYALNPLIILEYTGNLHMEGLMIAGLLAGVLLSQKRMFLASSIMMSFSICSKLLSLILIPFMPREMYWKRIIQWSAVTILFCALIFILTFGMQAGWIKSVGLWFHTFEFNAGIYYLVREIDAWWRGYEDIKIIGPAMGLLSMLFMILLWIFYLKNRQAHWSVFMVMVLTIYFLMSTTLHPWYLGTLIALSVISGHLFPVVWSYFIFLSYSHYADNGFNEKYIFIITEYSLLFLWIIFEFSKRKMSHLNLLSNQVPS